VAAKADVAGLCIRTLKAITFDYLVGGGQQCRWYREAERLGGFQINTIFERELCTASQKNGPLMSQLGQFRKSALVTVRSASPPTPDVVGKIGHVRKVPKGDIARLIE
jgi:hypothetical protein